MNTGRISGNPFYRKKGRKSRRYRLHCDRRLSLSYAVEVQVVAFHRRNAHKDASLMDPTINWQFRIEHIHGDTYFARLLINGKNTGYRTRTITWN